MSTTIGDWYERYLSAHDVPGLEIPITAVKLFTSEDEVPQSVREHAVAIHGDGVARAQGHRLYRRGLRNLLEQLEPAPVLFRRCIDGHITDDRSRGIGDDSAVDEHFQSAVDVDGSERLITTILNT